MNRRRMMMLQLAKNNIALLEDYKRSFTLYSIAINWSGDTLSLTHETRNFGGPANAYLQFISAVAENKFAQNVYGAFSANESAIPTLDKSKAHRLTLTVTNVNLNEAADESSGNLYISLGTRSRYAMVSVPLSSLIKGAQIVVETPAGCTVGGAVCGSDAPSVMWDFDFDVRFEEV
ncbi:MAG: hypothetical protein IJ261_02525 [Clostridia bacterium]|nr:hypothetical protein [Clostridia bacterium]